MRYAMILLSRVIDIVVSDTVPLYPPDPNGNLVTAVECGEDGTPGMMHNAETGEFYEYVPEPTPPELLSETEQAILDTAVNAEYLVCLADMGL